ncbi:MAG: dolichyl-phosphate beta-glucosyltransferase [Candidatus Zipacnadales bacterium]
MIKLSIVLPAYNEERRLEGSLRSAATFLQEAEFAGEIVVVNDGSVDRTGEIAETVAREFPFVRLIQHEHNQGKGMAVRTGMLSAQGEYGLFADVDEAVPIREVRNLLQAVEETGADVAIGTRYHRDSQILRRQPWPRIVVSRAGNLLIRALLLPGLRDTQCGFKLFRLSRMRRAFERVTVRGFGFDLEILAIARWWGYSIIEVPVTWVHGEGSSLRLAPAAWDVLQDLFRIAWRIRVGFYGRSA